MANDMNQVALVGRLAFDPELRSTTSGFSVANLRVAFTTSRKVGEEWTDKSNFIDVVVFGKQAESLARNLAKGSRIGISGNLEHDEWTDKEGGKRSRIQVIAQRVQYLDSKPQDGSAPAQQRPPQQSAPAQAPATPPNDDDDIPF